MCICPIWQKILKTLVNRFILCDDNFDTIYKKNNFILKE